MMNTLLLAVASSSCLTLSHGLPATPINSITMLHEAFVHNFLNCLISQVTRSSTLSPPLSLGTLTPQLSSFQVTRSIQPQLLAPMPLLLVTLNMSQLLNFLYNSTSPAYPLDPVLLQPPIWLRSTLMQWLLTPNIMVIISASARPSSSLATSATSTTTAEDTLC